MTLAQGQVSVGALVMGEGTAYALLGFNPWTRQARADQGGPRAWDHGAWSGAEWQDQAVVPMRVKVSGAGMSGWLAAHQALDAAFAPSSVDVELRWNLDGTEYLMLGRPRMVDPDVSLVGLGFAFTQAAFVALYPRIYSGVLHTTGAMSLPVATGGLLVPFTAPLTVDGVITGGVASLVNAGRADTGLTVRVDGPVSKPRMSLQRPDGVTQTLRFDLDLASGEWLDVDTRARTVLLGGVSSRRGQTSGDWPILPAGTSTLSFAAANFNPGAVLTASYRDAW